MASPQVGFFHQQLSPDSRHSERKWSEAANSAPPAHPGGHRRISRDIAWDHRGRAGIKPRPEPPWGNPAPRCTPVVGVQEADYRARTAKMKAEREGGMNCGPWDAGGDI